MEDRYPNNSDRKKETTGRPSVSPVTKGELKRTTRELVRSQFYADDASKIGQHILIDIAIPAMKKLIVDGVNGLFNMIFWGGNANVGNSTPASRVSIGNRSFNEYHSVSSRPTASTREASERMYDFDYVIVKDMAAANSVIDQMQLIIDQYDSVRASEFCALAGITAPYIYNDYGWDSAAVAQKIPLLDGRVKIQMPKAKFMK